MNMSYCRFQNTLNDLRDCYRNWDADEAAEYWHRDEPDAPDELSDDEHEARTDLLALCREIVSEFDDEHAVVHVDELG